MEPADDGERGIVDALIGMVYVLLSAPINALPAALAVDYSGVGGVVTSAMAANRALPVFELTVLVGAVLAFNAARLSFFFVTLVYKMLPGKMS